MSSFVAFGSRRISLADRSRSSFAHFFISVCVGFYLSSGQAIGGYQWEVQALSAEIHVRARRWCSVLKKVFTSRAR
jgi:hypothetical protein